MALVVKDRVQETTTTSGTGTLTLSGAVPGFQTFSTAIGNGNTTFYTIYDSTAYDWEVGIGTVGAGTLARTTVLSNSAGTTSPISFAGNSKFVFCTYPAEKSINYDADGVATIGEVLGYSDTGIIGSFASTVAGYNQVIIQNKSTATNASANFNVSNDAGTAGSNYAELGINSSTFVGTGSFNIAGASYVASASTDLTLGTYGAYNVHFVTNSNITDAMTIFNDGGISLGGFANPGIANMAASKFVPGYTAVTSAAGTTILTEDSNYYQNLLGTTTQTFQLPDATTLLVGTTFIFDNDSTGALTITDNASGSIDTIPAGGTDYIYLADNSTVAGTWRKHAFIPASYDFNNSTASFGNASITNAVWNGTTIGTAYGGTGLTSFSAANYALYSTSSSALTAGTLPVAAGGTGATTFTTNGVVYGDGTNPLGVTAAGTTGQVLVGNTGGAPSWGTLSSSAVTTFSAGTTGFTPSSATSGAITLAGTLNTGNGGTGTTTSFTTGSVVFAGASGVYSQDNANLFWDDTNDRLGIGTSSPTTKLTISNNTVLPSAGAITGTNLWQVGANATNNTVLLDGFGATPNIIGRRSQGTSATPTATAINNQLLSLFGFGYGTTGYSSANRARIQIFAGENWTDTAQGTYIAFSTTANTTITTAEKMRIDDAGNVGIGTSSPIGKLSVAGGTGPAYASLSQISDNPYLEFERWTGTGSNYSGARIKGLNDATGGLGGIITFETSNATTIGAQTFTERMRIDSSGSVLVGATSNGLSGSKLYVNGSAGFFSTGSPGYSDTGAADTWWYLGNIYLNNSDGAVIEMLGTQSYSAGESIAGKTTIYLRGDNSAGATISGYFYGETQGNSTITGVAYKQTTGKYYDIWVRAGTFYTLTPFVKSSSGLFTLALTNTGSATQPTGSTALSSLYTVTTAGIERMRIDSSGNVGIGVTPSSWGTGLSQKAIQIGPVTSLSSLNGGSANYQLNLSNNAYFDGTNWKYIVSDSANLYTQVNGTHRWSYVTSGTAGNTITFTEAMRISSTGGLSVGTTADPGAGAIYATGNITSFYTSDIKLKENIKDVDNALDKVCAIGAKTFDWKDEVIEARGGEDGYFVKKSDFGVIAQDVQEVFPQAVRTRDDGTLAVDYEKLAVLSFGAIKELVERIKKLEAK